jgi:hypothetical protein
MAFAKAVTAARKVGPVTARRNACFHSVTLLVLKSRSADVMPHTNREKTKLLNRVRRSPRLGRSGEAGTRRRKALHRGAAYYGGEISGCFSASVLVAA